METEISFSNNFLVSVKLNVYFLKTASVMRCRKIILEKRTYKAPSKVEVLKEINKE